MTISVKERERQERQERTSSAKGKQSVLFSSLISNGAFGPSSNAIRCNENFGLVLRLVFWDFKNLRSFSQRII
jgi:hypothetical protein